LDLKLRCIVISPRDGDGEHETNDTRAAGRNGRIIASMDAYHEKRMAMFDACLGQAEANTTKTVPDPGMMQSAGEHQDVSREEAAITPVKGLKKRRRVQNLAWTAARRGRMGAGEFMDLGESRLSPAGRRPVVQHWHGERRNSYGKMGPRIIVDSARSWPSPG
jgi:hypothetical protein